MDPLARARQLAAGVLTSAPGMRRRAAAGQTASRRSEERKRWTPIR
jgi:hypothetical protein